MSSNPKRYVLILLSIAILTAATSLLGPRYWSEYAWLAGPFFIAGFILKLISGLISSGRSQRYEFQPSDDLASRVEQSQPSVADIKRGFRSVPPKNGVHGSVHLSKDFNVSCMANSEWDIPIEDETSGRVYESIISEIRLHRLAFKQNGLKTVIKKLFDGKALINERKIGVACDFSKSLEKITVYESSYFATWCSGDLAHSYITERTRSANRIHSLASDRVPFDKINGKLILRPLSTSSLKISAQLGINFLGITKDNVLLIAIQGNKTMVGQNKRVPLATGSMDWEDRQKAKTFKELGEIAALRELREEWGNNPKLRKQAPLSIISFLPLGIFRVPDRSGKPEFAALGRLNWNESDLTPDNSEVYRWEKQSTDGRADHRYSVETFDQLKRAVDDLLNKRGGVKDTTPLYGVLLCLNDLLQTSPDIVRSAMGYED